MACGLEDFDRGQVFRLDTEDRAEPGKGRVPGNPKINAFEAIRSPVSRCTIALCHSNHGASSLPV